MPITPRERLARLLDDSDVPRAFSTLLTAPAGSVKLTVDGAGQIKLPIAAAQAKRLIEHARQARFGRGEETLTDLSVRDTWEVIPEQVTLAGIDWDTILADVRDELGLPRRATLRAELHSMLIYGKGQFFLPHQDSEKDDAMIGTLVMTLPSPHTGGELVVEHNGARAAYPASRTDLTFAAFYADCRHEVKPVKSGHRIALTFNLLMDAEPAEPEQPTAEIARCLAEHFATRISRWRGEDLDPPNRLIYLLDHQYTQRGLDWSRLKGADAKRAALLKTAAGEAGCDAVLALTEVREIWEAPTPRETTSIIDSQITLGWLNGDAIELCVQDTEVCATTPSASLKPYQSEYERYMGNYGNTMDRWYHRAAIVVWPRERAFAVRAEVSRAWALAELRARLDAGQLREAREAADSVASFWKMAEPTLLETALHVAADLDAPETAAMLLRPFRLEWLTPEHAGGLAALGERYGESWMGRMAGEWFGFGNRVWYEGRDPKGWIESLPALRGALHDAGDTIVIATLLTASWTWMEREIRHSLGYPRPDDRREHLGHVGKPLARLLEAADDDLRDEITGFLGEQDDEVLACALPTLRATTRQLESLARDCAERLAAIVTGPIRQNDDWSIPWPAGCTCDLCATLRDFVTDPSQQKLEWPLAKDRRQHVHQRIDTAQLPVRHETWRFGSPYTLVLTKTEELFTREQEARQRAVTDLAWLTEHY